MSKKHNDYWSKRSDDIMHYVDGTDIDMFAELQKVYVEQSAELQRDLFAFVTKYADDNKMSYSDALQRLRGVDLSNYQANAKKYRKQAEKDPELLKRLNEQYAGSKVTRLDALNLEMTYKVGVMQGVLETSFENYLKSTAKYAYKKAMGGNNGALNEPALKELINTPFNGRNYSQQLWGNTDDLARDLRDVLKRGFIRGDDVRSMAGELAKKYNVHVHELKHLLGQMEQLLSIVQLSNAMKSLVWNSIAYLYRWTIERLTYALGFMMKINVIELMSSKLV